MSKKITGKFVSDTGHSWLSMNLEDFATLGVTLSPFSYINWTRVYAEEDLDATTAINAGVVASKKSTFNKNGSGVRKCHSFSTELMHEIIRVKKAVEADEINCPIGDYKYQGTYDGGLYLDGNLIGMQVPFNKVIELLARNLRKTS